MIDLILRRYCYSDECTLGQLELPSGKKLWTVERPWIYNKTHGSEPFKSCVPDGVYDLSPVDSPKYGKTWAMVNSGLKVHQFDTGNGRYACLIHSGNTAADVVGCIAVGTGKNALSVTSSRDAMTLIRKELGEMSAGYRLVIIPHTGTDEGRLWRQ